MPVDYGPAPDREGSGSWGPGDDTGVVYVPSTGGFSFDELHWANIRPIAQMVVANLGSISPGDHVVVAEAGNSTEPIIRFEARRASGAGDTVEFGFGIKSEFGGTGHYIEAYSNPEPWLGASHQYAWAHHTWSYFDSRASQGTISSRAACGSTAPVASNYSGAGHLALTQLPAESMKVSSTAPSDLRVTYVASWFNKVTPVSPTAAQFQRRFGVYTCGRRFWVGTTGFRPQ